MKRFKRLLLLTTLVSASSFTLTGCDPSKASVYGSIGVSSGYSSYYGSYGRGYNSGPRMHGSISIGGRIR